MAWTSMLDVVVLPCVPETAIVGFRRVISPSRSARCISGARRSGLLSRDRARVDDLGALRARSRRRGRCTGSIPAPLQRRSVGRAGGAVGAGDARAERLRDDREPAHPRPADPDEVQFSFRPGPVHPCHPRAPGRRIEDRPGRAGGVRVRRAAPRPAGGDRGRARRPRRAGRDVDRLGEVGDLPDRRAADAGRDDRRLAADRAPARPGGGVERARGGRRRAAELDDSGRRARARAARTGRGHARVPLPGAGAARAGRRDRRAVGRRHLAVRGRRGALRVRVGP